MPPFDGILTTLYGIVAAANLMEFISADMFTSSRDAITIRLLKFLLNASLSVATARAASPGVMLLLKAALCIVCVRALWLPDPEAIADNQQSRRACVYGSPKEYDQWTIYYHEVKLSSQFPNRFVLDPAWVARHQTVGDTDHFSLGTNWVPWAENRCQYTCNAREDCVSFVGYQAKHSTPDTGEFYCYFFDTLIQPENIVPQSPAEPHKITHAYNRLCDNETDI